MLTAKIFIYSKAFNGPADFTNFTIVEEELPDLRDGEFLAEAAYVSLDPRPVVGEQVARIIESKHPDYHVGRYVVGSFGWRTHTICKGNVEKNVFETNTYMLPEIGDLSPSLGLGVLGSSGSTAYFGLLDILDPKPGEILVVTVAGGAVGSLVGQIAKIKGLSVIGIAGSDEKGKWLTEELGFDHFLNYKTDNVAEKLLELAPDGIDCFFDSAGGDITKAVLQNMKMFGRVSICGAISSYNDEYSQAFLDQKTILFKQLKIEGFLVIRWLDRWMEAFEQILKWINEGKLKYRETITKGFENIPEAFTNMMNGGNTGKTIVQV